ncbi:hypothetical protein KCU65_g2956, partial [Aureobasidium melanogenum]
MEQDADAAYHAHVRGKMARARDFYMKGWYNGAIDTLDDLLETTPCSHVIRLKAQILLALSHELWSFAEKHRLLAESLWNLIRNSEPVGEDDFMETTLKETREVLDKFRLIQDERRPVLIEYDSSYGWGFAEDEDEEDEEDEEEHLVQEGRRPASYDDDDYDEQLEVERKHRAEPQELGGGEVEGVIQAIQAKIVPFDCTRAIDELSNYFRLPPIPQATEEYAHFTEVMHTGDKSKAEILYWELVLKAVREEEDAKAKAKAKAETGAEESTKAVPPRASVTSIPSPDAPTSKRSKREWLSANLAKARKISPWSKNLGNISHNTPSVSSSPSRRPGPISPTLYRTRLSVSPVAPFDASSPAQITPSETQRIPSSSLQRLAVRIRSLNRSGEQKKVKDYEEVKKKRDGNHKREHKVASIGGTYAIREKAQMEKPLSQVDFFDSDEDN